MSLADELNNDPEALGYAPYMQSGDNNGILKILNEPRFEQVSYTYTEAGVGTILETMGLDAGNNLIDAVYAEQRFRYVKPLLESGSLNLASPLVQAMINELVSEGLISPGNAESLLGKARHTRMISRAHQVLGRRATLKDVREGVSNG